MNNMHPDRDKEVFHGFLDESLDSLTEAEKAIVELEAAPQDLDIINIIFRAAHSLKGNAAFFGLMKVKKLAHKMEDLLDAIRQHQIGVTQSVIDILLPGLDLLRRMLENAREDAPECDDEQALERLLGDLKYATEPRTCTLPQLTILSNTLQCLGDSLPAEKRHVLEEALKIVQDIRDSKVGEEISFGDAAAGSGKSQNPLAVLLATPFEDIATSEQCLQIDTLLTTLAAEAPSADVQEKIAEAREVFNAFSNSPIGLDNRAREMMLEVVAEIPDYQKPADDEPTSKSPSMEDRRQKRPGETGKGRRAQDKSLRIAESSLDAFLDHVGELIRIEEMLRYCLRRMGGKERGNIAGELKQVVEQFCKVSADLRNGIMDIRKVKAQALMDKAPRLVRDVAASAGKRIAVRCNGADVRIDKSYAELLDAPLVHMVRNAADHGIETPAEREQCGKPEEGTIRIELSERENDLCLIVSDDGRGLDYDALSRKADELGILDGNRSLSQDEIVRLLFMSGVSTASEVTEISGRGVGMDVVKQSIEAAGGQIRVSSTPGQRTEFILLLPKNVSTKIVDGYLVRSTDNRVFVLPLKAVVEAFVANGADIATVKQKGRVVQRRDGVHPLIELSILIDRQTVGQELTDEPSTSREILVLLEFGGKRFALSVAEIIGVQKVVVNPIDGLFAQDDAFEGAAVMGDGSVALILGELGLSRLSESADI